MKLEYVPNGSPDAPLIRFYDFDEGGVLMLRKCFIDIKDEHNDIIALHEQVFIDSVGGCKLWIAEHANKLEDENAVLATSEKDLMFTWMMTKEQWSETIELLDAYTLPYGHTVQWLTDDLGIQVLLSQSGKW
jgi:hypothetical protein